MSIAAKIERFLADGSDFGQVIFSSVAPIAAMHGARVHEEIGDLVTLLASMSKNRNILIPAFPRPSSDKTLNLDTTPSINGVLSEGLRKLFPFNRTLSRFFPFTAIGPSKDELFTLRPKDAWGEGSLYEWIERNDLDIVTIGLPSYVCSVQHRAEYLEQNVITYRAPIERTGTVVIRNETLDVTEKLLARLPGYEVDFRPLQPLLAEAGQVSQIIDGILVSRISAKVKLSIARSCINADPDFFATKLA